MIVHKCDICGKEMSVWLLMTTDVKTTSPMTDIHTLLQYIGQKEICTDCYLNIIQHRSER